jgi:hypothetical protein
LEEPELRVIADEPGNVQVQGLLLGLCHRPNLLLQVPRMPVP